MLGQPSVLYFRRSQSPVEVPAVEAVLDDLRLDLLVGVGLELFLCGHGDRLLQAHYITRPPLMLIACPVMNAAAGEARYSAAAATSAGVPQRPSGVDSATERRNPASASSRERGLDPARAQDVDPHRRRERARQALAVGEHAALDRAEHLGIGTGHAARDVVPAHVHDRAAAGLLAHHGAGRVRARDRALDVDGEQEVQLALPVPAGRVAGEHVGAGVVDPHVEAAEPLARLRDERLAARARAEVGAHDDGVAAPCRDVVGDRERGRLAAAVRQRARSRRRRRTPWRSRRRCRCSRP